MTEAASTTPSKAPSHLAYHVREREGKGAIWTPIGRAWPHQDQKGFSIALDAFPVEGRLTLRVSSEQLS